ncbi:right-handed parallel beta-helix repeat-containing protein [Nannocystis sp. SCPEA4]|uniref:right-handed parallel beta-helix repeat-containing protein n=1 Tax=Nannocystis sp. SCPEA4 TaxID=2996787 RepID=UPI00226D90A0|nr:right-handed parallel beta-helix repeat-containing protein [Nannocystis sp. SCPEA4]MCY1061462.1 right-handed parallel beta-helix repeat-containing protein [Nannocystis sp. SCPEA4]
MRYRVLQAALVVLAAGCTSQAGGGPGTSGTEAVSSSGDGSGSGGSSSSSGGTGGGEPTGGGDSSGGDSSGGDSSGGVEGSTCPLPAYPDADCTGVPAGTALTVVEGDLNITEPDTVIDGKDIRGCVSVNAPGVVIRNSRVSCPDFIVVSSFGGAYEGTGLVIEDSEIDCQGTGGTAVGDTNFTVRRVDIHGCENGFDLDGDVLIEDSYIHDMYQSAEAHTDGAQLTPVGHDVTLRHNTIYANEGTSAFISPEVSLGIVSNIRIESNLMAGGAYTLYCQQDGPGSDYRVVDNHFSTLFYPTVGAYGPWTDCEDETEVHGNVYHETDEPLPGQ